jgi:hypothetical protein
MEILMQSALERLIDKIHCALIDPLPSDNIFMEDVFDPALYGEILAALPADEDYDFIEHPDAILPSGIKTRKLLDLTDATISSFKPGVQDFWRTMKDILVSDALQKAIVQKFQDKLKARFGERYPEMVTVPILYRDFAGYRIGVHTDAPYKIATLQFYLPKDDSQIHLGTSFHQKEGDSFRLMKVNRFYPNSAYAFARTDTSWHSVEQMSPHEQKRDTLALTIYEKGYEYKSGKAYK